MIILEYTGDEINGNIVIIVLHKHLEPQKAKSRLSTPKSKKSRHFCLL